MLLSHSLATKSDFSLLIEALFVLLHKLNMNSVGLKLCVNRSN